jgi:hypothetical protein
MYFLIHQEGLSDPNPDMSGPYKDMKYVKRLVSDEYSLEDGDILTILYQKDGQFRQVSQCVINDIELPWKDTK